jgi:CDP-diacylglycerol--serine O-phosphatidyltransferase
MKKIYILPNLFTTGNFFCGMLALLWAFQGRYVPAGFLVILAMVFDFTDGQVARLYHATSRFGVEYDSLADFLTFGVATSVIAYRVALADLGRFGIAFAFLYAVMVALRLARFNTQVKKEEKTDFTGLPCPIAAGVVVSYIIFIHRYNLKYWDKAIPFLMIVLGVLMVSTYTYPTLLSLKARGKTPFLYLVATILALAIIIFWAEIGLLLAFLSYLSLGLAGAFRHRARKRKSSEPVALPAPRPEGPPR